MKTDPTTTVGLRLKDAAAAIGVSPRTLWGWTIAGIVPHKRIGRVLMYSVKELERWLADQTATESPPDRPAAA